MSNLLEKASIITTPTAYDDGRILSVKPNENLYGSELITNGDFATDSDWTKGTGWTISGGTATYDGTGGTSSMVQGNIQNIQLGKNCKVTLDVLSNEGNGANTIFLGGTVLSSVNLSVGSHTFYGSFTSNTNFYIYGRSGEVLEIDNVSVVEDLSGDFNFERGSAATRVNAQGLVENVQILSSELVQNGNFSEIGSEEVSNGDFSQEGSELITNGDFATDSNWAKGAGWVIENGKATHIGGSSNSYLNQTNRTVVGKNYKAVFTFSGGLNSNNHVMVYGVGLYADFYEYTSDGTYTLYFTADATFFRFRAINPDNDVSIDNVSVVEVGQDWQLQYTGTGDWSITDKLNFENVNGGSAQLNVFEIGKTYKITLDYVFTSGTRLILPYDGSNFPTGGVITTTGSVNGYTYYYTPNSTTLLTYSDGNGNGSIDNISVKEVGQHWTLQSGWSIGDNKAICDGTNGAFIYQSTMNLPINKKVIITVNISSYTSGSIRLGATYVAGNSVSGVGTHSEILTTSSTGNSGVEVLSSNFIGSIDRVSVKEITDDTDLPRINYEGFSYQDVLGSELITNGDFAVDGSWVKGTGWTISGGSLNALATTTATFQQNTGIVTNKTYKVTYTISNYVSGSVRIEIGSANVSVGAVRSANGTYTEYITALGDDEVYFDGLSAFTGSIDNVSVKEYLGQQVVPNSGCGSWLFEPQSTNLYPYSQTVTSGGLTFFTVGSATATVTNNYSISPDGTQNALRFQATVLNDISSRAAVRSLLSTSAVMSTVSVYAKSNTNENYTMVFHYEGGVRDAFVVTPEWQRFSFSEVSDATNNVGVELRGTYTSLEADVSLWGFQFENQSYATSVIPTNGAASTRLQDIANNSGNSDLFNSTEGVLYAEIAALDENQALRVLSISDGSLSNRVLISLTNGELRGQFKSSASIATKDTSGATILNYNKIACSYTNTTFKVFVNGIQVGTTSTSLTALSGINEVAFDRGDGNLDFIGKTKALAVWKEALTDTELELLTAPAPEVPTFSLDFDTIAEQFTFTRGSEATFVNEQGLIQSTNELGAELVTNGNFATDSDWGLGTGWSIAEDKAIYTGTTNANLTQGGILTSGNLYELNYEVINSTLVGGVVKLSGATASAQNVLLQTVGTHKLYFTADGSMPNDFVIRVVINTSGQFEIGNISVKELTTATNTPRIDYSTGVEAFLLEPQSTNLVTYSEDFTQWNNLNGGTGSSPIVTLNNTISPNGTQDADKIVFNSGSGTTSGDSSQINNIVSITSGTDATASLYLKGENGGEELVFRGVADGSYQKITLTTEWQRFSTTENSGTNTDAITFGIRQNVSGLGIINSSATIYAWGAQLEEQSYATSYIPTDGATATRNQETCVDATPTINSEEGVLYAEIAALADDNTLKSITLSDGTTSNRVIINYSNQSNRLTADVRVNSVGQAFMQTFSYTITNFNKIAIKYKENDFALWVNGTEVATDTSGLVFPSGTLNKLNFDNGSGGEKLYGNTKGLQVFDKALSDYQLKQLTTI